VVFADGVVGVVLKREAGRGKHWLGTKWVLVFPVCWYFVLVVEGVISSVVMEGLCVLDLDFGVRVSVFCEFVKGVKLCVV
jgi:hypothetical protein